MMHQSSALVGGKVSLSYNYMDYSAVVRSLISYPGAWKKEDWTKIKTRKLEAEEYEWTCASGHECDHCSALTAIRRGSNQQSRQKDLACRCQADLVSSHPGALFVVGTQTKWPWWQRWRQCMNQCKQPPTKSNLVTPASKFLPCQQKRVMLGPQITTILQRNQPATSRKVENQIIDSFK